MANKAYLVGAGPGDVGLLTLKAKHLLEIADVVLYDRLVSDDILSLISNKANCIDVGKKPGAHRMTQEEITQELVNQTRHHQVVVRLKGGDPFVFGRGSEEIMGLIEAGIDYEVIPGITSALSAPAYSGIPITHRGVATSFHVFTGHFKTDDFDEQFDFETVAKLKGTLVFLMSVGHLPNIVKGLISYGKAASTPAAIIENGTRAYQRHFTATLGTLEQTVRENKVVPPSIIVIGDVAAFSDKLYKQLDRPLLGKKIIVTRARAQASELKSKLQGLGAKVLECPAIRSGTRVLSDNQVKQLSKINDYQWLIFTSSNAVTSFFELLNQHEIDQRMMANTKFCVIGKKTKKTLRSFGYNADIMPATFHAFNLKEALLDALKPNDKLLRITGGMADESLITDIRNNGYICDELRVYDISSGSYYIGSDDIASADAITFTSGSTIKHFNDYLEKVGMESLVDTPCIVIGPTTKAGAKSAGYQTIIQSDTHTIDGVVKKVIEICK